MVESSGNKPKYLSNEMTKSRLITILNKLQELNKPSQMTDLILTYDVLLSDKQFKKYQNYLIAEGQIL